ncbi:MAG: hypothetical protein RIQ89_853 [Bacteroidota bacterium]|jgi:cell division protein FtsW
MNRTWIDKYLSGDKGIWIAIFILTLFSAVAVYTSTGTLAYKKQEGNTEFYLFRHAFTLILGLFIVYLVNKMKYTIFTRFGPLILLVSIIMLGFTLVFGTNLNSASRWLTIPIIGNTIQTSDIAKVAIILYLAGALSKKIDQQLSFKELLVPVFIPILLVCALILPANLSTAAMLFVTCLVMLFVANIKFKYLLYLVGIVLVCCSLFIGTMKLLGNDGRTATWMARIENFTSGDDKDNYQAVQAKIAVATGGLTGKKPGNSDMRNYLPHPYSDFIFAIIVEEYGILFSSIVIICYLLIFFRTIKFLHYNPKALGTLLAFGYSFLLVFQAMINMAVAVNLFPVTGQPLPLVSMGGTNIIFNGLALGIILSVSHQIALEKKSALENTEAA